MPPEYFPICHLAACLFQVSQATGQNFLGHAILSYVPVWVRSGVFYLLGLNLLGHSSVQSTIRKSIGTDSEAGITVFVTVLVQFLFVQCHQNTFLFAISRLAYFRFLRPRGKTFLDTPDFPICHCGSDFEFFWRHGRLPTRPLQFPFFPFFTRMQALHW